MLSFSFSVKPNSILLFPKNSVSFWRKWGLGNELPFSHRFTVDDPVTVAQLTVAVDDWVHVTLNGTRLATQCPNPGNENGPADAICTNNSLTTLDVTRFVHAGDNDMSVEVGNTSIGQVGWENNPAGLLLELRVD